MNQCITIQKMYEVLLSTYGPQGWWPLLSHKGENPTKTGSIQGYHPGDYSFPKNEQQRFEICVGAILTQNTNWTNVEKALLALQKHCTLTPQEMIKIDDSALKEAIRPAGYFNQKAKKLKIFTQFFLDLNGRTPKREELLNIWGIGPETADSILLYAYAQPEFVVDAYTKRIFTHLGIISPCASYEEVKATVQEELETDFRVFQELHALLVEHAKRWYAKKPYSDPLLEIKTQQGK